MMSVERVFRSSKGEIKVPCGVNSVDFAMCRALSRHEKATPIALMNGPWPRVSHNMSFHAAVAISGHFSTPSSPGNWCNLHS
jgi:hypothetical protein